LWFTVNQPAQAREGLRALGAAADGERLVVGIGASLAQALGVTLPGLRPFPSFTGSGFDVPATPMALWCWLRGTDPGEVWHRARRLEQALAPAFRCEQVLDTFLHDSGRDLTGYEDGTENPKAEKALAAAIVDGQGVGLDGSSFVAVQQWQHDFARFEAMSAVEQDHTIGRQRETNEELADAPASAHVKRTAQESFEPAAFVLRRSMPWVEGDRAGLLFIAFGHSLDAFEALLRRMVGEEDGISDALFRFTRPVTGAYFWCPPLRDGKLDLRRLGL
jgi:putative iron-dependent peroxidase